MPDESLAAIHGRLTEDQTADQDSAESPFVYPDSFNAGRPEEISSSVDGSMGNPNDLFKTEGPRGTDDAIRQHYGILIDSQRRVSELLYPSPTLHLGASMRRMIRSS